MFWNDDEDIKPFIGNKLFIEPTSDYHETKRRAKELKARKQLYCDDCGVSILKGKYCLDHKEERRQERERQYSKKRTMRSKGLLV